MIHKNIYIHVLTIMLTALLAGGNSTLRAGVVIKGSVYGGGNQGEVQDNSEVNIEAGTIEHDVYGGGNAADVKKNTQVNMTAGTVVGNIFGGGNLGDVGTTTPIAEMPIGNYTWAAGTGRCTVDISGGTVGPAGDAAATAENPGDVYGGGKGSPYNFWCEKGMVNSTVVRIRGALVKGDVYGGGQIGRVETNTSVTIGPKAENNDSIPTIKGSVYGAGKGLNTHGYSALVRGNTNVIVQNGSLVEQNVYGGGEIASVGKYNVDDSGLPYSQANSTSGNCTVNIPGRTQIKGDIFGGGKGVEPVNWETADPKPKRMDGSSQWEEFATKDAYLIYLQTLALATNTIVTINPGTTGSVIHSTEGSVYGGSENGIVQHNTTVTISGNCQIGKADGSGNVAVDSPGNVFGGGKGIAGNEGAGQVSGNATVNINSGTLLGSVYGGGVLGATRGDVTVNINGGTVNHDVYGGGAYANTNTSNWTEYVEVPNLTVGSSSVTDYYEESFGGIFSKTKDTVAKKDKKYYQHTSATWADSEKKSANSTTHVNLRGGTILGDAYGGALGDGSHAPSVYGDILVDLNGTTSSDGLTGTNIGTSGRGCVVTNVFGCNNAYGSPQGNVTVHVYGTQNRDASKANIGAKFVKDDIDLSTETDVPTLKGYLADQMKVATAISVATSTYQTTYDNESATAAEVKTAITGITSAINAEADTDAEKDAINAIRYDIQAVYGGGNKAAYEPAYPNETTTSKTRVIIEGCSETSINEVYGGGNAAAVPSTDVTVNSAYEINYLFGGGNGKSTATFDNPGADVGTHKVNNVATEYGTGIAKTTLLGGEIHVVYGGSNEKGNIVGGTSIEVNDAGTCTLKVGQIYGAGNNAEMDGGTDIVMGCMPEGVIEEIYAGARNADVAGDVKLTLTSGKFGRVFGGNKHGGKLKGSITVNIEETGDCSEPLIIGELYGGGNLADYSVYGYDATTGAVLESGTKLYNDPKLNVHAFTSIGAIYGGGYRAKMVANPTVDINVAKGSHAATEYAAGTITGIPTQYKDGSTIKNGDPVDLPYPAHEAGKIGAINNVFGGGNLAPIVGNATVNVGTATKSYFKTEPKHFRVDAETPLTPVAEGTYAGLYEATVEGAIIKGSIYGGGNEANITGNTQVNICAKYDSDASEYRRVAPGTAGVTIDHDVFGAGKGIESDVSTALVSGNTTIVMMGGEVKQSVYGGGELSQVGGNTNITVNGGTIGTSNQGGEVYGNIYSGGKGNAVNVRSGLIMGNTNITVQDIVATAGNAAYYGVSEGTVVATPAILHNIYGGGAHGSVGTYTYASEAADAAINGYTSGGTATINILGGTIGTDGHNNGMVFGSSRGDIDAPNTIYDKVAWVYDTHVNIGDATSAPRIWGSVYGSGENGHTYQNASVTISNGTIGDPDNYFENRGNVYGGGCGTDRYYSSTVPTGHTAHDGEGDKYNHLAGFVKGDATVTINGGSVANNVYGAGSMGKVGGSTYVTINTDGSVGVDGTHDDGNVYGAARGELDLDSDYDYSSVLNTHVTISKGTVKGNVFGGGKAGKVKGSVAVDITGGRVIKDVYGGGALADTNTDNWNGSADAYIYEVVFGLTVDESDVSTYYTRDGSSYTKATGKAASGVMYYERRAVTGDWVTPKPIGGTDYYTTTLNLTGGIIGNAYGGGLGQRNGINGATSDIAAMVYGDVTVTVNGTAFTSVDDYYSSYWYKNSSDIYVEKVLDKDASVPKTGRVFGCNNLMGSPKGDVKVVVRQTKRLDEGQQHVISGHEINEYEIRGVYGGGNLSHYEPADGKGTSVEIHDCDNTSIEKVYGGGNAADVPATDVKIYGCFDIHYVFGGGNGADVIYRNGRWEENDGANVNGNASVALYGGTISDAFIGSDTKGTVYNATGDVSKPTTGDGECALKLTNYYGSSKRAEVYGDVSFKIDACSNSEIENVYAGSYDAQIHGSITMTVTSGILKNVFGGNDRLGSIGGDITINIEEADACKPIIIQNLYGGGFNAPYPGEGATKLKDGGDPNKHEDYTKAVTSGKITINLKSFTRIDNIYGGGKGYNATVTGSTEINVNMAKGVWAGQVRPVIVDGYSGTTVPNVHSGTGYVVVPGLTVGESPVKDYYKLTFSGGTYTYTQITDPDEKAATNVTYYSTQTSDQVIDDIGSIGNIYGGGDQGAILGTTSVNIGTATTVSQLVYNSASDTYAQQTFNVLGANITGNVYAGGNQAEVTGNTQVNICAKENTSTHVYESVTVGASGVTIQGTEYPMGVFGGGNYGNVGGSSSVYLGGGRVNQSVYGGGCRADVKGNASVTMLDGYVYDGVYGGGLHGSVGTFGTTTALTTSSNGVNHASHTGCIGKPTSCTSGGTCTVVVSGGQVGPNDAAISSKGMTTTADHGPVDVGFVFGAGRGEVENPDDDLDADFRTYVNTTNVTISGGLIMASVYGGGENGRVLGNTLVTISGGQIGCGVIDSGTPAAYTDGTGGSVNQFIDPTTANLSESTLNAAALAETSHWPFGYEEGGKTVFKPYDPYADDAPERFPGGSTAHPSDGKTYYGSVFGGGSGYFPYVKAQTGETVTDYDWLHSAGVVEGNTVVNITGGHILTNVYGGNEYTDVLGSCRVTMSGGTIGVPRTAAQIAAHPLSGLLFGAGKGDQRSRFYEMTNVGSTIVTVSGGIIYGSVFGGAEDGHVLGNTSITINDGAKIGTWGTTGLDGNVFGGGRGFSGTTLGAGNVGGNVTLDIKGGKILGSIYGGGRMASVGTNFSSVQSTSSGQFIEDGEAVKYQAGDYLPVGKAVGDDKMPTGNHGHITINISGGIIGNTSEDAVVAANGHTTGGNVFGGSMGRLTLLDGTPSGLWVKMAQAKATSITISNGTIKSNVYGAGELGTTRDNATINITAGTINGSVFGGGYGSAEHRDAYRGSIRAGVAPDTVLYIFNPLQYAGCLGGEAIVNVSGGTVNGSVYGGGELASVGVIDYSVKEGGPISFGGKTYSYNTVKKHGSYDSSKKTFYDFGLSWPYEFEYVKTLKDGSTYKEGGKTTVNITGSAVVDNYVFGGGKGMVSFGDDVVGEGLSALYYDDITKQRYTEAHVANVRETAVTIGTSGGSGTTPTVRTVYGGGDDGHVMENANVTIHHGTIQRTVFGGGKGVSTYKTYLWNPDSEGNNKAESELAHSWTAGKVYGNTNVTINNGNIGWFVYGGGNMASVGKGNYSGGSDDYSTGGYGEMPPSANQALWTNTDFTNSGNTTVTIKGGTVGPAELPTPVVAANINTYIDADGIPYGSVFGGSRGYVAKSETKSPRYRYMPDFFLGYVNKAIVNIGGTTAEGAVATAGPTIYGSVYGGGQDGHVRNSTEVKIFKGSITGQGEYETAGRSGHIFGAGSGIGKYTDGGKTYLNNSSGSVTCTTLVEVNGGSVAGNIYGGGAMAAVGPYRPTGASSELHTATPEHKSCSYTKVDINGGAIGGSVFGASRGSSEAFLKTQFTDQSITYNQDMFATDIWSDVNISGGTINGNVYGGGEGGRVVESTSVILTGGVIGTASAGGDVFGGGKGTLHLAANVGGNTSVELNPGKTAGSQTGCVVRRIFGCNDVNGSPLGHASVHVYATQHRNKKAIHDATNADADYKKYDKYENCTNKTIEQYDTYLRGLATTYSVALPADYAETIARTEYASLPGDTDKEKQDALEKLKRNALDELRGDISDKKYDVLAVYGGGNLAMYEPTASTELASVVIDGCELTSIRQVYGGGNAASTPANSVLVNGTYEIDEVFGGGNGKDSYLDPRDSKWYKNPGANVGYKNFTHKGDETGLDEANAISQEDNDNAKTKEGRQDPANGYVYGSGVATTTVVGGRIHYVYGGSNKRGNICTQALSVYQESGTCELSVDDVTGAGKDAKTDAEAVLKMDCVSDVKNIYGGSTNADVYNNVVLTITNGTFENVFGGNNTNGAIHGSITVNIEEGGCQPIHIDNLYAGGFKAPYSVYGYEANTSGTTIPKLTGTDPVADPCINVISASYIGNIYGGGYQATVVGNPHVNVNMTEGKVEVVNTVESGNPVYKDNQGKGTTYTVGDNTTSITPETKYYATVNANIVEVTRLEWSSEIDSQLPTEDKAAYITSDPKYVYKNGNTFYKVASVTSKTRYWAVLPTGYINNNIYGGGNMADIIGDTHVEIGTGTHHDMTTGVEEDITPARNAADIRGAVFGGGDEGNVTGNTYVTFANGTVQKAIYGGGDLGDVGAMTAVPEADPGNFTWADDTGVSNVTITGGQVGPTTPTDELPGNVFGGGKGDLSSFYCEKGMVYATNVSIENGTVKGNVYGGGEIGRVEQNTTVTIGLEGNTTNDLTIEGDVFGAAKGKETHGYSALVRGNSSVTVQGKAWVNGNVYGGGEVASVGKYNVKKAANDPVGAPDWLPIGMPYALANSNSGYCTVIIRDNAEIGPNNMVMHNTTTHKPDDKGHVFGAGKGVTPYQEYGGYTAGLERPWRVNKDGTEDHFNTDTYGEKKEAKYLQYLETLALATQTDVTIGGNAFVKGSVYGGSENGLVQKDTHVRIQGDCQIGNGYDTSTNTSVNRPYTAEEWATESLPECSHWVYGRDTTIAEKVTKIFYPYDPFGEGEGVSVGCDGHTFYGNVFGGGSGYYPYAKGKWHRVAGAVFGNTVVDITGGHILTSVYGGNEMTDVGTFARDENGDLTLTPVENGKCTVNMTGGTLGVPRTLAQIAAHPVTCYLFGAGKGDQRVNFNMWTNVIETEVNVSGNARIFGSTFGGGEDGHVINNVVTNIGGTVNIDLNGDGDTDDEGEKFTAQSGLKIGTTGTSYVDGNVFGGGRGFSGEAITAGSISGNVTVNISGGTMLGSVYGGGRLAGVGTRFTAVTDPYYGQLQPDPAVYFTQSEIDAAEEGDDAYGKTTSDIKTYAKSHGHITVNISGGTIGNTSLVGTEDGAEHSGNVFGGSMGRLTLLDGSTNPIWPKMAVAKSATTNISGTALITGSVYGGCEMSMLRGDSHVTIGGVLGADKETITSTESDNPVIMRNVFGGGYGSDEYEKHIATITAGGFSSDTYTFTPMQLAGIVCGDTHVNIKRGSVKNNIYGGGEMATVGLIDFNNAVAHTSTTDGFGLSWPYEMTFIPYDDSGVSTAIGGTTNVTITGGRIGSSNSTIVGKDNGNIYGGSQGRAGAASDFEFCGNVKNTYVTVNYPGETPTSDDGSTTQLIMGSVFGGAEDGHVIEDTHVSMKNGLVLHSLFAGGRGEGTYAGTLKKLTDGTDYTAPKIRSITAGKVYGNTYLEMTGGAVWHNVFGGGYMASVGKGNYAGGADDYANGSTGYGETLIDAATEADRKLWKHSLSFNPNIPISNTNVPETMADYFLSSGKAYLTITGGTVGKLESGLWDGLPSGNVFGSSRGVSAPNITDMTKVSPEYCPEFFSGYVNETFMTIGGDYKCIKACVDKNGTVHVPGRTLSANQMKAMFTGTAILTGDTPSAEYWIPITGDGPKIYGSVYGGGQDGHVRREAHMIINKGEVGVPYTDENVATLGELKIGGEDNPLWLLRGNLFGAGSGIGQYSFDMDGDPATPNETGYSTSAGSVTHFTVVDVYGGIIHRNIYGGGSLASVGPPPVGTAEITPKGSNPALYGTQSMNTVNIFGTIGTPDGYPNGTSTFKFNPVYGGEVYGASRGLTTLDHQLYSTSFWTRVTVFDGARIMNNVFGGGDAGVVKKDTDVRIGEE